MKRIYIINNKSFNEKLEKEFGKKYNFKAGYLIDQVVEGQNLELLDLVESLPIFPDSKEAAKIYEKYGVEVLYKTSGTNHSEKTDRFGLYPDGGKESSLYLTEEYANNINKEIKNTQYYDILIDHEMTSTIEIKELKKSRKKIKIPFVRSKKSSKIEDQATAYALNRAMENYITQTKEFQV